MMSKKVELFGEELDLVNGGQITYTWDGNQGSIGIGGYNPFVLVNKAKFVAYYNAVSHGQSMPPYLLMFLKSLLLSMIVGYVLIFLLTPVYLKLIMKKNGGKQD